jgi:hypothetical protein
MTGTQWLAWVGAFTGPLSLGWQVFTWVRTGPRLRVTTLIFTTNEWVSGPINYKRYGFEVPVVRITVENRGTAPTTIKSLLCETYPSRWARFRRRESMPYGFLEGHEGPPLPYRLEGGGYFVAWVRQNEELTKWIMSRKLRFGVKHSCSTKPVLAYPKAGNMIDLEPSTK